MYFFLMLKEVVSTASICNKFHWLITSGRKGFFSKTCSLSFGMEWSLVLRVLYLERDARVLGKKCQDSQEQWRLLWIVYIVVIVSLNVFFWKVVPILFHNTQTYLKSRVRKTSTGLWKTRKLYRKSDVHKHLWKLN